MLANRRRPLEPLLPRWQPRRRAAEDQPLDPLGLVRRQPHPDHAAEREAEREPVEPELVSQREHLARQSINRVQACRGSSMPGIVIADDPVALRQCGHLRLPQAVRPPERAGEHERRPVALDDVVQHHSDSAR